MKAQRLLAYVGCLPTRGTGKPLVLSIHPRRTGLDVIVSTQAPSICGKFAQRRSPALPAKEMVVADLQRLQARSRRRMNGGGQAPP
ncbi:MAG TPA: hypothetical protein VET85_07355 [Stellaceae bacterium]|nr:hypothetical protein [Stellaceae bacterium]